MDDRWIALLIPTGAWAAASVVCGLGYTWEQYTIHNRISPFFRFWREELWDDTYMDATARVCAAFGFGPYIILATPFVLGKRVPGGIYRLVRSVFSSTQGVLSMKRKIVAIMLTVLFGGEALPSLGYQPHLFPRVAEWWNAPPAPPSPEALKLIASLEEASEWRASDGAMKKGEVKVVPHTFWADVCINGTPCNGQFSVTDLRAINKASSLCMRKLTTRAMNAKAAD